MKCEHDLAERDTACADGLCPLCLSAELAAERAKTAKLVEAGDWLCDLTTNGDAQKAWAAAKADEEKA